MSKHLLTQPAITTRCITLAPVCSTNGGSWTIHVKDNPDDVVCIIFFQKVLGYYALAEKVDDLVKIK